jgi:hypothetical protein
MSKVRGCQVRPHLSICRMTYELVEVVANFFFQRKNVCLERKMEREREREIKRDRETKVDRGIYKKDRM